jgi:DNA-binding HxlR family transcriptional regulator
VDAGIIRRQEPNALEATLDVIRGKWKGVVLFHLCSGKKRFNELRRLMPDLTPRMLTLQLRELERDGVVRREIFSQIPPKVEYSLTPVGQALEPALQQMREWGERYARKLREHDPRNNSTKSAPPPANPQPLP